MNGLPEDFHPSTRLHPWITPKGTIYVIDRHWLNPEELDEVLQAMLETALSNMMDQPTEGDLGVGGVLDEWFTNGLASRLGRASVWHNLYLTLPETPVTFNWVENS